MSFFETLNEKFFNPFCCRNRALYFECISQLIEKSKEISVLYETDARNTLILYLQNCTYSIETENIGEEIAGGKTPQENASTILRYFRACFLYTYMCIFVMRSNCSAGNRTQRGQYRVRIGILP